MKLQKIIIEKFGIFHDLEISDLNSDNINLICENNEFGKTTLFEFVRRCIYGFCAGVDYGMDCKGTIILNDESKNELVIERSKKSVKKDILKISYQQKEYINQDAEDLLMRILPVNSNIFKNVYAFSLDELQDIKLLDDEDIKIKIFGAGQGINSSINSTLKTLNSDAENLFKKRGQIQVVNKLLKEIDVINKELKDSSISVKEYDEKNKYLNDLKLNIDEEKNKITELNIEHRYLEQQQKIVDLVFELKQNLQKQNELLSTKQYSNELKINQDDLNNSQNIVARLADNEIELRNLKLDCKCYENKNSEIEFNDILKNKYVLKLFSEDYQWAEFQLKRLKDKQSLLTKNCYEVREELKVLGKQCRNINKSWSLSTVRKISLDQKFFDDFERLKIKLNSSKNIVDQCQDNLDNFNTSRYLNTDKEIDYDIVKFNFKDYSKLFLIILSALICGIVAGFFSHDFWISSAVIGVVAFSLIFILKPYKMLLIKKFINQQHNHLHQKLKQAQREYEIGVMDWENFLNHNQFPNINNVDTFENHILAPLKNYQHQLNIIQKKYLSQIKDAKKFNRDKLHLASILLRYYLQYQKYLNIENYKEIANLKKNIFNTEQYEIYLSKLKIFFSELQRNFELLENNKQKIDKATYDIQKISIVDEALKKQQNEVFNNYQVENYEQLKIKFEWQQQLNKIQYEINNLVINIQRNLNINSSLEEIIEQYGELENEKLFENISNINDQLTTFNNNYSELNKKYGAREKELEKYCNDSDIKKLVVKKEQIKSELKNAIKIWAAKKVAHHAISQALEKFQHNHQPEVINNAAKYFYRLVGDSERNIEQNFTDKDKELLIKPSRVANQNYYAKNHMIDVTQLSRGAKEQLFLAMRLALIEKYQNEGYDMPIIMDDILVNFDEDRRNNAIKLLIEFAKEKQLQIIFMSCTKSMIKYFNDQLNLINTDEKQYAINNIVIN